VCLAIDETPLLHGSVANPSESTGLLSVQPFLGGMVPHAAGRDIF
jgi:hypothetical protein